MDSQSREKLKGLKHDVNVISQEIAEISYRYSEQHRDPWRVHAIAAHLNSVKKLLGEEMDNG